MTVTWPSSHRRPHRTVLRPGGAHDDVTATGHETGFAWRDRTLDVTKREHSHPTVYRGPGWEIQLRPPGETVLAPRRRSRLVLVTLDTGVATLTVEGAGPRPQGSPVPTSPSSDLPARSHVVIGTCRAATEPSSVSVMCEGRSVLIATDDTGGP